LLSKAAVRKPPWLSESRIPVAKVHTTEAPKIATIATILIVISIIAVIRGRRTGGSLARACCRKTTDDVAPIPHVLWLLCHARLQRP